MKRVTFEIDEALLVRAERLAAARGVSVGVMVAELLAREADADSAAAAEARREMGEMARRPDIPRRMIPWTREELYERGVSGYERDPLRGGENAAALVSGSAFGVSAQVLAEFVSAGRRKLRPALTEEVIGWWLTRLERQDPLPIDAGIVSRGRAISAETRPQLLRWRDPRGRQAPRLRRGPERRHDRRPLLRRRGGPQSVRAGMTMAFRRVALSIVAGLALAAPAAAQTQQLPWALSTCLNNVTDFRGAMKAFEAAGYRYAPEDFGGGPQDVVHWFTAPDGSVTAAIAFGSAHDGNSCRVIPKGVTVAQAVPYAKSAAEQLLGVRFTAGAPRGSVDAACSNWAKVGGRVVQVAAGSDGQDPACDAGAPAQIMIDVTKG